MSSQPPSARQLDRSVLGRFRFAARCLLSGLPGMEDLRRVPTPKAAFRYESVLLTVVGVLHVLAPLFLLHSSLLAAVGQHEEVNACADDASQEAIGAMLVALIQAIGSVDELAHNTTMPPDIFARSHLLIVPLRLSRLLSCRLPGGCTCSPPRCCALQLRLQRKTCYCLCRRATYSMLVDRMQHIVH